MWTKLLIALVTIGALVWVATVSGITIPKELSPAFTFAAFASTALVAGLAAVKWRYLLHAVLPPISVPFWAAVRVTFLGLVAGQVIPQDLASASARTAYLSRAHSIHVSQGLSLTFLDRWLDLLVMAVCIPVSLLLVSELLELSVALTLLFTTCVVLLLLTTLAPVIFLAWASKVALLASSLAARFLQRDLFPPSALSSLGQVSSSQLAIMLSLSMFRFVIVGARAWLVAGALGLDFSFATLLVLTPLAQLTLLVPTAFGGLGVYDAGWYGLLVLVGIAPADALLFVAAHRSLGVLSLLLIAGLTEAAFRLRLLSHGSILTTRR